MAVCVVWLHRVVFCLFGRWWWWNIKLDCWRENVLLYVCAQQQYLVHEDVCLRLYAWNNIIDIEWIFRGKLVLVCTVSDLYFYTLFCLFGRWWACLGKLVLVCTVSDLYFYTLFCCDTLLVCCVDSKITGHLVPDKVMAIKRGFVIFGHRQKHQWNVDFCYWRQHRNVNGYTVFGWQRKLA